MKAQITNINVKLDIWDTYYTIKDYSDRIILTVPYRKYESDNEWGLSFYDEVVTHLECIQMLRKCAQNKRGVLVAREGMAHFNIVEISIGLPLAYGWKAKDFQ
ncbi:hypothetical protein [Aggregatibacter actinomycetemcomitans]|uniref:hypothetical protein n=1 Tax=Aggregatibacter actinomycetemcomitans TaxID=714 RepID=UPI0011DB6CFB|nr:hypothetical protein [Aggregatibacter actinomycetemcomitans]TYA36025.1 hypothetical protein FXE06_10525 [Aggregatibacter actinomycetemcomitans]